MSERAAVNKLYLEHLRGAVRPIAIILPADRWARFRDEMLPQMVEAYGSHLASETETRAHFLYLNTPIVCGDAEAVEMPDEGLSQ